MCTQCLWAPEEGVKSPGMEAADGDEWPCVCDPKPEQSSERAASVVNR